MAPAIVLASASPSRPAVTITEPSSPSPRPTTAAPARPDALHPSSARRSRSPSPAPRSSSPPLGPRRAPLALPLPGQSPLPGGNIGRPDLLAGPGGSVPICAALSAAEEARLVEAVINGPTPTNMAVVAMEMGWETPAYWAERIAEIRAAWPAAFQSVIERRPDCWMAERDVVAKQCLEKNFLK
ncbi:MAG: hypothetical protein OHK93_008506 [Ramalina farinacea]|uniref:Uncharacterized protein n=1 Tax=Ramalina farinacea TaxID=258253 RepID=A0AA43TV57_9LECA|nr:hypothetical protein [Ramalina farinacea]